VAASYALWAVSHNFTLFVLARILGGVSKGNISLCTAIVADVLPPEKRGRGMVRVNRGRGGLMVRAKRGWGIRVRN
jgi:predicted MFS family arabinose efflux permease